MVRYWGTIAIVAILFVIAWQMRPPSPSKSTVPVESTEPISSTSEPESKSSSVKSIAPENEPEFRQWLSAEAKSLDYPSVDSERKQAEIEQVVKGLTRKQARTLLKVARDPVAASGEKILSTYLMVEAGAFSRAELLDFIKDPLETGRVEEAHSLEELGGVREKSLRIMALDGLFAQAKSDPAARVTFAREIQDIQDPYVKAYAERRLSELESP